MTRACLPRDARLRLGFLGGLAGAHFGFDLPRLAVAIERRLHLHQPNDATTQEATI
jgi:hypothetical protein